MSTLPTTDQFNNSSSEAEFQTHLGTLLGYLSGLLGNDGLAATALATLGTLGSRTITRTGAGTVSASDRGAILLCSGTWTLTMEAASALGAGFSFGVINTGTGVITIDPVGSETINGVASKTVSQNGSCTVVGDGQNWRLLGDSGGAGGASQSVYTGGSGIWTKPLGNIAIIECFGGGGAGGRGYYACGGGGGGYSKRILRLSDLGVTESFQVGSGGGRSSSDGGAGGYSAVGNNLCIAYGGGGGAWNTTENVYGTGGYGGSALAAGSRSVNLDSADQWRLLPPDAGYVCRDFNGSFRIVQPNGSNGGGCGAMPGMSAGQSIYGGGGGGSAVLNGGGGYSVYAGRGGAGSAGSAAGGDGVAPGGGGGASRSGNAGNGATGLVRITVF